MSCDLPSLNWARLRILADGSADVLDSDGHLRRYHSVEAAVTDLEDDEFIRYEVAPSIYPTVGVQWADVRPPSAADDSALIPKLYVRVKDT